MNKKSIFLITFLITISINKIRANDEIEKRFGIKLSPTLSKYNTEGSGCSCKGPFGFEGGFFVDFIFRNNHAINTGILVSMKRMELKMKNDSYKLSITYLNLPLLLKLHSNEFWIDTQLYLFTGVIGGLKLSENTPEKIAKDKKLFKTFKIAYTIGVGIEYEFAMTTSAFLELGYKTHIFDVLASDKKPDIPLKNLYSHTFLISIGIRF
ncbi:MAG: outer membrane beta-barrel protein [Bacteroidetes bacterium]|nr:outer membrane beta-barrel protein [Bacteroidota bacterium]